MNNLFTCIGVVWGAIITHDSVIKTAQYKNEVKEGQGKSSARTDACPFYHK